MARSEGHRLGIYGQTGSNVQGRPCQCGQGQQIVAKDLPVIGSVARRNKARGFEAIPKYFQKIDIC
jgi:hypothetical protein